MTEKQEHLLKLFKEIDEICKEHDLRYVMAGGTLIGVWRHEGFVPWDDDVDIYMPREDWDRFVEICKTELPPERAIQCSDADRRYSNSFPRYASTDSCAVHKHQIIANDLAGEIIDVLTLDPIPADDKEYEKYRAYLMIYSELINVAVLYGARWEIPTSLYLKYLLSYLILGKDRTLKKLEKIMFSYKEEDCDRYAMRWGGCPFLFDKDMMFPVKYGEFEGEKVMIPHRTSDYLIWHYGDEWSYIPPHGEREAHEAIEVEGATFKELREQYMPEISKTKIRWNSVLRKVSSLRKAKKTHKYVQQMKQIKARSEALDLKARIAESAKPLSELLEQKEFKKLNHIFEGYFRIQLSADFIGREDYTNIYAFYHPVLLEVEDDVFLTAMFTLFYTERISKAHRMLKVREQLASLTPKMRELLEDIELFRKAVSHYEFKEMEEAERTAELLLGKYPEHPGFMKFRCRFLMEQEDRAEEAEKFIDEALALFPEDGYFLKYRADLLWRKGMCQTALEIYAEVREKTTNGIVWLEMEKKFQAYKNEVFATCDNLLEHKAKEEAKRLMELWLRLLPDDEEVQAGLYLTKVACAHEQEELESLIKEILKKIEKNMTTPLNEKKAEETEKREISPAEQRYRKALTKAWKRLGYQSELAEFYTELKCADEESELELLAEKIRSFEISKDRRAEVYKLVGDARAKQGQTNAAFGNYLKALEYAKPSYVKTELTRIIMEDLNQGSKRAAVYAKKSDALPFMNQWLGKYGTEEDIRRVLELL